MSHRTLLIIMILGALLAWGGLLLFTRFVAPSGVPSFLGFFSLLGAGLLCIFTPLIYLVARLILAARNSRPTLGQATRQAGLISAWIIFNLLLRLLHSWSIFTAIVSFGIIVVLEFLALGRN
jgi:hypothetical protein